MTRIILASSKDRPKWLKQRLQYVTASEAPTIMGVNRYQTPAQLFAVKMAGVITPPNKHMQRGIDNEPKVLESATKLLGTSYIRRYRPWDKLIASTKYPWLACTIDGVGYSYGRTIIMEAKCPERRWKTDEWQKHLPQLLVQMLVTGIPRALLLEGIGPDYTTSQGRFTELHEHRHRIDELLDKTERFHKDMKRGVLGHDFWEASL